MHTVCFIAMGPAWKPVERPRNDSIGRPLISRPRRSSFSSLRRVDEVRTPPPARPPTRGSSRSINSRAGSRDGQRFLKRSRCAFVVA
eukprot:scaffold14529_cov60-Phaeocystis_antarctica.AAC.5